MALRWKLSLAVLAAAASFASAQAVFRQQVMIKPGRPVESTPSKGENKPTGEFVPDKNASADPKSLDVPDEMMAKARGFTTQLGSTTYKDRELASRELAKLGRLALPALREAALNSLEPEVALRSEVLMPRAEAEDMKARVNCFLLDAEGKYEHTLPGWKQYKAVTGGDKLAREMFAEALKLKDCHSMLLAVERDAADDAGVLLSNIVTMMNNGQFKGGDGTIRQMKPGEMLMALFTEAMFSDKKINIQISQQWGWGGYYTMTNYLYNQPELSQAMSGSTNKYAPILRKVLEKWMDTRETMQGVYQAYNQSKNSLFRNSAKTSLKYAAKLVVMEAGQNFYMKTQALTDLGQGGGTEYLGAIAKSFDDSTVIQQGQWSTPRYDIEMRDFALSIAVQMTEQKPEDYGLTRNGGDAKTKNWYQGGFYFKDDRPDSERFPNGNGGVIRPGKPGGKPDDKKPDEKDPKEKKQTADDRRKVAFKKWEDWAKDNIDKDGKQIKKPAPKAEPKPGDKPVDPKAPMPTEPVKPPKEAEPATQPIIKK